LRRQGRGGKRGSIVNSEEERRRRGKRFEWLDEVAGRVKEIQFPVDEFVGKSG
jgi:hypothetical protein